MKSHHRTMPTRTPAETLYFLAALDSRPRGRDLSHPEHPLVLWRTRAGTLTAEVGRAGHFSPNELEAMSLDDALVVPAPLVARLAVAHHGRPGVASHAEIWTTLEAAAWSPPAPARAA